MPYCPNCGQQLPEGARYCDRCGEALLHLDRAAAQRSLLEHIRRAARFTASNPLVFIPEAIAGSLNLTVGSAFTLLGQFFDLESLSSYIYPQLSTAAYTVQDVQDYPPEFWIFGISAIFVMLIYAIISGMFTITATHMVWTGIKTGVVSLGDSVRYILSRFWQLLLAIVLGNLIYYTVILVPAAFFMYTAMIVDSTGIKDGLYRAFNMTLRRLDASIAIIILDVIFALAFGYIPYIGKILFAVPKTILLATMIELYTTSK